MNDLVEIYSANEEATDVGKIIYENNKYLLIQAVDDQGKTDGYLLFARDFINNIKKDSPYLEKIKACMPIWSDNKIGKSDDPIYKSEPDFRDLILFAKENHKMVLVAKGKNFYDFLIGSIRKIYQDGFDLEAIDRDSGEIYGDFYLDFNKIKVLEIETIDLFLLESLRKNHEWYLDFDGFKPGW